jgi:N6-adenosine-specific RNA methylase IME4
LNTARLLVSKVRKNMIYTSTKQITSKYSLVYADPPWKQSKGGAKSVRPNSSGLPLDYTTVSLADILDMLRDVTCKSHPDSVLFLWAIDKYLWDAEQIADVLGYKLHARMIWNKVTGIPAAYTIRFGHEYLLYCYRGKLIPVAKEERGKIHSVFTEQVKRHSQKPEIAYQIIERLYPNIKKIEMFSRKEREGWDSFGNEIEKLPLSLNFSDTEQ